MEVLQGDINRDDYYSVRECAEILGVTTKTVRNRIEDKKLNAVWYDLGRGKSQWLILKTDIQAIIDEQEEKLPRQISLPPALLAEIKESIKAEMRAENAQIRAELQAVKDEVLAGQERIEKTLLERDARLLQAIRERQEERQQDSKNPWWKFW